MGQSFWITNRIIHNWAGCWRMMPEQDILKEQCCVFKLEFSMSMSFIWVTWSHYLQLLDRSIDLNHLVSKRINIAILRSLNVAISKFEADELASIIVSCSFFDIHFAFLRDYRISAIWAWAPCRQLRKSAAIVQCIYDFEYYDSFPELRTNGTNGRHYFSHYGYMWHSFLNFTEGMPIRGIACPHIEGVTLL